MHITSKNVNHALPLMVDVMTRHGIAEPSRNGPVLAMPEPLIVTYTNPLERVCFSEERDANPFFHYMESIYFFAGREDVKFLSQFVKNMENFSDNGEIFNASYGKRIRSTFGHDQFADVIRMLKKDPTTRRAVIQIWNHEDLCKDSKDFACNLQMLFQIREGKLNVTVTNRSNDVIYGMLGANVVQFSMFQEYVAAAVGVEVGVYNQITNNAHVYTDLPLWSKLKSTYELDPFLGKFNADDAYDVPEIAPHQLVDDPESFLAEAELFCEDPLNRCSHNYKNSTFVDVAKPLYIAYIELHKKGATDDAIRLLENEMRYCDWRVAALEWLNRRKK